MGIPYGSIYDDMCLFAWATNPVAILFIALQHNFTVEATEDSGDVGQTLYSYGKKDFFTGFFYFLIAIVIHAVIQEYLLDKINRRMHLSKVKHSKFNESGQLMIFYIASAAWGVDIIVREGIITSISSLWDGYPHVFLPFILKFYFICQLAYWVHCYPELYFYKIKKDEMWPRIQYATLYLVFIAAAYILNLTRIALCLLVLHYAVEFIFHLSRLLYFSEKTDLANTGFMIWKLSFVLVRLGSITLGVLTFWYGLEQVESKDTSYADGDFNTQIVRINCLAALCILQAWMMWNFITFHLRRAREAAASMPVKKPLAGSFKKKTDKKSKGDADSDENSGVETSQENGTVRHRSPRSKRQ